MKKKEIEKIPYRTAEKAEKKFSYIAASFVQEVKGTEHLLVEIYRNKKEGLEIPHLRIAFTKEDWGIYWPEEAIWSSASIRNEYDRNIWESSTAKRDSETYMDEESQNLIWEFCRENVWYTRKYSSWTDALKGMVDSIRNKRRTKRDENRRKRLEERKNNTPDLPENLKEWAETKLFYNSHFLYYKRNGRYADIACSACGKAFMRATKRSDTFIGQFESTIEMPKNGKIGKCPECGALGTWRAKGKTKGVYGLRKYCFIGQPYKETGAVIRYVQIEKIYRLEEHAVEKDTEMIGAKEDCIITEIARRYLEKDRKPQTDYHKYSSYSGEFWDDCNLYGMDNISIKAALAYENTYQMLQETILQYSGAQEFNKECREYNMMDYMEQYMIWPQIEILSKMGLYRVVESIVNRRCGIIVNQYAKRPEDFLGIRKCRIRLLRSRKGDLNLLNAMQIERRMDADWTEKELEVVSAADIKQGELEIALQYMSMQQLVNRLEKYAECEIAGGPEWHVCENARERVKTVSRTYFDYLDMREQRGYDLHNTVFLFPKNLQYSHDLMVEETNRTEIDKREAEVKMRYPDIRRNYRSLRNRYFYEDESYLIRPARSAEEIVREGRMLHHCVGGNGYLQKHNDGKSTILLLRIKDTPEQPYITVEIRDTHIVQWYGAYDKKPDEKVIDKWLKEYINHLKETERLQNLASAAG
ncbi:MAG: PcfJ domain-containing protein [Lachnospiraceae bacterium]|nr:PcfJ domain-containing protein [Lachnospiraceae bacterium]